MRRLAAITQHPDEACTRYRVSQYRPYLESQGKHLEVIPWPKERNQQQRLLRSLGDWDAVVVQRRLPDLRAISEMRRRARRLVFDFDDAIVYRDSARGKPLLLVDKWARFRALVRRCDAVTAGNSYLAALASRHALPGRVFVLPTAVPLNCRPGQDTVSSRPGTLGWIGSRSTLPYLEQLCQPLQKLCSDRPELCITVVSDQKPNLGTARVQWRPWKAQSEMTELQQMRVGLAPLPDDRWTRGKCGLRLLQYLAAGVPAVASPVGTQAEITREGGALEARTKQEWISAITRVLDDPSLAHAVIAKGSCLVARDYNTELCAAKLERIWCGE